MPAFFDTAVHMSALTLIIGVIVVGSYLFYVAMQEEQPSKAEYIGPPPPATDDLIQVLKIIVEAESLPGCINVQFSDGSTLRVYTPRKVQSSDA